MKKKISTTSGDSWCPNTWKGWIYTTTIALIFAFGVFPALAQTINGCHEGDAYFHGLLQGQQQQLNITKLREITAYSNIKPFCQSNGFDGGTFSNNLMVWCSSTSKGTFKEFEIETFLSWYNRGR